MSALQNMTQAELIAMVERMQVSAQRKLTLKVSEKGAVSMYGLGRFPVTLYAGQWERLLDEAVRVRSFITDNAALVTRKV